MTEYELKQKIEKLNQATRNAPTNSLKSYITQETAAFVFSTENLADTYRKFSPQNKEILTVGASGDHAFDAYLNGAKTVDMFDFNIFQECVIRLKFDLIKHMSYQQFVDYFFNTMFQYDTDGSKKILKPFENRLSPLAHEIVERFYTTVGTHYIFDQVPFFKGVKHKYKQNKIEYIQSEFNYNKLKKCLPDEISFKLTDATTIANQPGKTYDLIHMSNIFGSMLLYANSGTFVKSFCNSTFMPMSQRLNPNGTLIMDYRWDAVSPAVSYMLFSLMEHMESPDTQIGITAIESVIRNYKYDTLVYLKKTR